MKRYNPIIATTAAALLLATNIASAQSPVYGAFSSSGGVTLPTTPARGAAHPVTETAPDSLERVYGAFRRDHGITLPGTRGQLQPELRGYGAIAGRKPDVLFGNFVTIGGVTAPIINGDLAQAPVLVSGPATTVAAP